MARNSGQEKPIWVVPVFCFVFLVILVHLPNGAMHLYFGRFLRIRDFILIIAAGVSFFAIARSSRRLTYDVLTFSLFGIGLLLVMLLNLFEVGSFGVIFRQSGVLAKWILLYVVAMGAGALSFELYQSWRPWFSAAVAILGLYIFGEALIGYFERYSGAFFLDFTGLLVTEFGSEVAKTDTLAIENLIRVRGLQRSVFAFSNLIAVGAIFSAWISIQRRQGIWLRVGAVSATIGFTSVTFVSGGRSALLGLFGVFAIAAIYFFVRKGWKVTFHNFCVTLLVLVSIGISVFGIAESVSFAVTSLGLGDLGLLDSKSSFARDSVWLVRWDLLLQEPLSLFLGLRVVDIGKFHLYAVADNLGLWVLSNFGGVGVLGIILFFSRSNLQQFRRLDLLLFALTTFILVEGFARESIFFPGMLFYLMVRGFILGTQNSSRQTMTRVSQKAGKTKSRPSQSLVKIDG